MKLRKEVQWFAEQMERQLQANDEKGGWDDCEVDWLIDRMKEEWSELIDASIAVDESADYETDQARRRDLVAECCDVANFAMMIAHNEREDDPPK